MTHVLAFLVIITAMLAPYVLAAALTAAFPGLRRRIGQTPSTGEMVAHSFDGDPDARRMSHDLDATRTRFEGDAFLRSGAHR